LEKLGPDAVVVHIHFGMAGTFHTFPYPGPEPRPTTRLRLENKEEGFVAHLSASLCVHCNLETYRYSIPLLGCLFSTLPPFKHVCSMVGCFELYQTCYFCWSSIQHVSSQSNGDHFCVMGRWALVEQN
jgi:hypothetical protein